MRSREMQVLAPPSPRRSAAYQLTPIWERVVRTRRLPAEVDLSEVFEALRRRLKDPEREVRQHALRVLADLIPVIRPLDARISPILPEILYNLGHTAPAVRKGALDALKIYLSHSELKQSVLSEICTMCLDTAPFGDDVTIGLILALPSLLQSFLRYSPEPARSISTVIKALSTKLLQPAFQDVTLRSMSKIRETIGSKEFDSHINTLDPNVVQSYKKFQDQQEVEPTITVGVDNSEEVPNGKVILETDFAFDSDTEITMTIMEEDVKANMAPESEDDSFDYTTYNKSLVKVLTDSEQDEYEAMRKTPRRVRFGGEVVKMRTPDSDNVNNSDDNDDSQKNDSENDERNKKKSRSMIPLPTMPIKSLPKSRKSIEINKRKSKSLNDLSEFCINKNQLKSDQNEDLNNSQYQKSNGYLKSPIHSPKRLVKKTIKDTLHEKGFPVDDLSSGYSGNSSTGSGSSSDNAYEDFSYEDFGILDRNVYRDLFKNGDDRAAVQALEKLTREIGSSAAAAQAIEPSIGPLCARLAALGSRGRSGIAATGLLRALIRSCRPSTLKNCLPQIASAIATQGNRGNALTADLSRRLSTDEIIDALLNQSGPHWKSSKLRAGALRVVANLGNVCVGSGGTGSAVGARAARAAAGSCRHPRRRVRAAALDALASLAHLASPRAVLAALHYEASDRNDGDQLYDAVFARLCRSEETRRPGGAFKGTGRGVGGQGGSEARPDLAWVMAGSNSVSPPSAQRNGKRLDSGWARSAPDLPALIDSAPAGRRGSFYSYSAQRTHEQDKGERNLSALVDTRVLTTPPTGVTLRPLLVQHVQHQAWPRQGLAWPQQPAPPWTQNPSSWSQPPAWSAVSAPWGNPTNGFAGPPVGGSGGGGSWPQRRPPSQLRALTPPPNRPKLQPLTSQNSSNWSSTQDEEGSAREPEIMQMAPKVQVEVSREDLIARSSYMDMDGNLSKIQYKSEDLDNDTITHKSENGFVRRESIPSQASPISREAQWRVVLPPDASSPHSSTPLQDSIDETQNDMNESFDNDPPLFSEDADESNSDNQRPTTPSTTELRFVHEAEVENELENTIDEERFINSPRESTKSLQIDNISNDSAAVKPSPTHSGHYLTIPDELDNRRQMLSSAPAISFLGSSVSLEDDRKSNETVSSEGSRRTQRSKEDAKSDDVDLENQSILGNKISPVKKTPKKVLPKAFSSKINRNKVQPIEQSTVTMLPFDKPKEMMAKCFTQLESADWETVMLGLQNMERLVRCHAILVESQMKTAARAMAVQIKNLRSQVARSACKLAGNMFAVHRKNLEQDADELAVPLLQRTADTNKFIRIDANDALDKMCEALSIQKSITILMTKGTVHPNAIVRCASTRLLANMARDCGHEKIFSIQKDLRDKLLHTGADLLTEGSLETRGHAKQLFAVLSHNHLFFRTLREVIPLSKYRSIEKTLNSLKCK